VSALEEVLRGRRSVPFGRAAERRRDSGRADLPPLSVYLDAGVVPRSSRDDNYNRLGADLSTYLVVEPGDIVFNKLRAWQGGLGVSAHRGIVSPAYFVCRPSDSFEPRYLHFVLRSAPYIAELARISKFMPPSQFDILWEDLKLVPIPALAPPEQRAIADFLDRETARIDGLIAAKRALTEALRLRLRMRIDNEMRGTVADAIRARPTDGWVPLRHVATVRGGVTLGKRYDGPTVRVPYLRVLNVQDGRVDLDDVAEIDLPIEDRSRFELQRGDLLLLEGNGNPDNLGRGTLWKGEIAPCIHQNHVHVVRPDTSAVIPEYLDEAVRTSWARHHFTGGSDVVGISTLSQDRVRSLRIFLPSIDEQRSIVDRVAGRRRDFDTFALASGRQVDLLIEHRQALITAAVTGELDLSGVAA
jgi:type I restriction enzyme S subunit